MTTLKGDLLYISSSDLEFDIFNNFLALFVCNHEFDHSFRLF